MTNQQAYETLAEAIPWIADPARRNAAILALTQLATWVNETNQRLQQNGTRSEVAVPSKD